MAEYVNPSIVPEELARTALVLCRWFKGTEGAYLIWEANGPGEQFGKAIRELGYRHFYYRRDETGIARKQSDTPGWYSNTQLKVVLLGEYREVLGTTFVNRSIDALQECLKYSYLPGSGVEHQGAVSTIDPSGARANHGDRVIADALCYKGMKERGLIAQGKVEPVALGPPPNCRAWREQEWEKEEKQKKAWCSRSVVRSR